MKEEINNTNRTMEVLENQEDYWESRGHLEEANPVLHTSVTDI